MNTKVRTVTIIALTCTLSALTTAQTFISSFTLHSGNTILQATGAFEGSTGGGDATSDTRTLYFFSPDFGDPAPNPFDFTGTTWPYVYVDGGFSVESGISADISTEVDTVGTYLTIEGNPVYQFVGDSSATSANGNFGPWFFIEPTGTATQSTLAVIPEPSSMGFILAILGLGTVAKRRKR